MSESAVLVGPEAVRGRRKRRAGLARETRRGGREREGGGITAAPSAFLIALQHWDPAYRPHRLTDSLLHRTVRRAKRRVSNGSCHNAV